MLFADSETQKLIRDTARSYLRDRYPWERLYAIERGEAALLAGDVKEMAGLGWLGLVAPESAGGGGASLLEAAVVIEELGYAGVPAPVAPSNISAYVLKASKAGQSEKHLADIAGGVRLYTVAEANREAAPPGAPRSARPEALVGRAENDVLLEKRSLTGTLRQVPFGLAADYVLAPITADGKPAMALIALEGARREPLRVLDRADYADVRLDGLPAGAAVVLATGEKAQALRARFEALLTAFGLVELAGLMQRVTEMTAEYISNRVQFGVPIAKFQAARHHAADMLMQTQTARWTAYEALSRFEDDPTDTSAIWLAKHWAIRASGVVFELAHLLHGGVGVGTEYPLHLLTQGVAALAVRYGAINEMITRINAGLRLTGAKDAMSG